jgi:ankyrin repeat protein
MYPNPQEALPLPTRPNVEQYKKLAKDLVKSCKTSDPAAIRDWAARWIDKLATLQDAPRPLLRSEHEIGANVDRIQQFALKTFARPDKVSCALTDAQFVIARAHGFLSWPKFVTHVESLGRARSTISAYEQAVTAIVTGDIATLRRVLKEHPGVVRARSTREHGATLLHYVSANGVEGYRQVSPSNATEIAEILLAAGAEVDAVAGVYDSHCTPLGLVATSAPPFDAGVQKPLIDVLLKHGARMDLPGSAGRGVGLVRSCLANGQSQAAEYLASRGAPLDLSAAAGLGRLDVLKTFFSEGSDPTLKKAQAQVLEAFWMACGYGRAGVVEFLLEHGVDVDSELRGHGEGHTGLHLAAFHGQNEVVKTLLRHGARVDVIDKTWGTPALVWALTGWDIHRAASGDAYYEVVARLVGAGANVTPDVLAWDKLRADPKMMSALTHNQERDGHPAKSD